MKNSLFSRVQSHWFVGIAIAWLLISCLLTLQLWPDLPRSKQQWALLLTVGPPFFIAGEVSVAWLSSSSRPWNNSSKKFSVVRIILSLPVVLAYFALAWWFSSLVGRG